MENMKNMENSVGSRVTRDRDELVGSRVPRDRGETVGGARRAPRDGWRKVRLGKIADCTLGKMLDHKKNHGTPHQYLANYNVRWGSFDFADVSQMPFEDAELDKYRLQKDDLVVCEGGEIGRCALWRDEREMFIQKALHRVRVHEQECNASYLYYWFLNSGRSDFFKQFTTGATILHLPRQNLIDIPVDLPPLPTQHRIAEILGAYDDAIENNRRRIALLEKMSRELYRERFVRRKCAVVRKTATEWFGEITIGKTPPRKETEHFEGNVPWVSISDMGREGMFIFETAEHLARESVERLHVKVVPAHTLLLSFKLTVGRLAITTCECCTNEAIAHLNVGERLLPYVYLNLANYQYSKLGNTCAISDGINSKIVKAMPIEIPDDDELDAFNKVVDPMLQELLALAQENRNLARQRDRLLPRLMSGRLEVGA